MAIFDNTNPGLDEQGARQVGSRSSWIEATLYVAGHDPVSLNYDTRNEDGKKIPLGNLLDHPDAVPLVRENDHQGLRSRISKKELQGDIRPTAKKHWDVFTVSLDREETAYLAANPGLEDAFHRCVVKAFRYEPERGQGERMALVQPIHKDTPNWHIQALVHRWGVVPSTENGPGIVSASTDAQRAGELQKQVAYLNKLLAEEGIDIRIRYGKEAGKSITADKAMADEYKETVRAAIEEKGGAPSERLDTGIQPGPMAVQRLMNVVPDADSLVEYKRAQEKEALSLEKRIAELQAEQAARVNNAALADKAMAALVQKAEAEKQKELAERLAAEAEARAQAAEATATEATAKATAEAERAEIAEKKAAEAAAELVQQREANAALGADNAALRDTNRELHGEKEALEADNAGLRSDLEAETARAEAEAKRAEAAEKTAENERLRAEIAEKANVVEATRADIAEERARTLEAGLEEARAGLETAAERIKSLSAALDAERQARAQAEQSARQEVAETRALLVQLQQQQQAQAEQNARLMEMLTRMQQQPAAPAEAPAQPTPAKGRKAAKPAEAAPTQVPAEAGGVVPAEGQGRPTTLKALREQWLAIGVSARSLAQDKSTTPPTVVVTLPDGAVIRDRGNAGLTAERPTTAAAVALVQAAQARGWQSVTISSTDKAFADRLWLEASKAGIEATGHSPSSAARKDLETWQRENSSQTSIEPTPDEPTPDDDDSTPKPQ